MRRFLLSSIPTPKHYLRHSMPVALATVAWNLPRLATVCAATPLLCCFLPKNIISNLFELFFFAKKHCLFLFLVRHATNQRTRSLQLLPESNASLSPLLNTYAKTLPTSFHAGCAGNRSVESPSACHSMRRHPSPLLFFTQKYYFKFV